MNTNLTAIELEPDSLFGSLSYQQHTPHLLVSGTMNLEKTNSLVVCSEERQLCKTEVPFPVTCTMFSTSLYSKNKIVTSSDCLRIYSLENESTELKLVDELRDEKSEFGGPLVTFDWNKTKPDLVGCCSVDSTCSIWNIEKKVHTAQLIAHKKEVTDFTFANDDKCFVTSGADGQVKVFDIRDLRTSYQIYQTTEGEAVTKVSFNPNNSNLISAQVESTEGQGNSATAIIDVRQLTKLYDLKYHRAPVSAFAWSSFYMDLLATAGEDGVLASWTVKEKREEKPYAVYPFDYPLLDLSWSPREAKKIALLTTNKIFIHSF